MTVLFCSTSVHDCLKRRDLGGRSQEEGGQRRGQAGHVDVLESGHDCLILLQIQS